MATVPAKSHQPLHNFSLPYLKWGQSRSHVNTSSRCRRLLSHRRPSPATDSDDSFESDHTKPLPSRNRTTKTGADVAPGGSADGEVKPWNLRPRKSATVTTSAIVNAFAITRVPTTSGAKSALVAEEEKEENEKKRKLWISLSREEIEEDVYAFSGSKPARRPKKRNKTVQKQLDNLFPGLYLAGISADSYRV